MQRLTNVAYLCEFPTLLGGEHSLLTFLAHHAAAGVEPVVVAPSEGPLAQALAAHAITPVAWPAKGRRRVDSLARALEPYRLDLVHANSLMTADTAWALGAKLKVPAVAHVRDIMTLSAARRDRLNGLAAIVAVSDAVATWLEEIGILRERITRIYNAVDVSALQNAAVPGALRRELGIRGTTPLVGCIGQIALRKGQDLFLEAASLLANRVPDVHFVVVGARYSIKEESRRFEADLRARSAAPPLAGRTHFLGYRDDVPSILADLDVLVVPSRQEPLSRVLLEGLAMGVPSVATEVGGSSEIFDGGKAGLLVLPDSPDTMAEAILRLLVDGPLRRTLAQTGLRRVQELLSPEAQVRSIREVYDRIVFRKTDH